MSNVSGLDYSNIESPFNNLMERSEAGVIGSPVDSVVQGGGESGSVEQSSSSSGGSAPVITTGNSLTDVWLETWIKSRSYKPGVQGFMIDGRTGDIQAANITLTGGTLKYGKTNFTDSTNAGYILDSDGVYVGAAADANYLKYNLSVGTFALYGVNMDASTITNLQSGSEIAIQGWQSDLTFSASDYRIVAWSSGTITLLDGTTYSIDAGNTGNMAALTYIYLDIGTSLTVLQTTTTPATAVGSGKILIAVAQNNSDTTSQATLQVFGGEGGMLLAVDNIAANSASVNEFVANTANIKDAIINNAKISDLAVGKLTAGTITSKSITLAITPAGGDVKIQSGKTDFGDTTNGFILGIDDSDSDKVKFEMGGNTDSISMVDGSISVTGSITITSGSGIANLADAGDLATQDDLDGVPDGSTYAKVLTTDISAGHILLSACSGDSDDIGEGSSNFFAGASGADFIKAIDTLDDVSDGVSYGRIDITDISSGHILLASCSGDLDDVSDGTNYGKIAITDISSGHILLASCDGDLDDISNGTSYGKVALTDITSGHITVVADTASININDTTFANKGIQFQYNSGTPRGYIGDGSDAFWQFDGSLLTWKAANSELDADGKMTLAGTTISSIASGSEIAIQGWQHDMTFSASDSDTVAWTSGTITLLDGTTYSIDSGNTGNMSAITYIYLDINTSTTVLQTTTTASTAVGSGKILICVAENETSKDATFQVMGGMALGSMPSLITADNITANTITANEIAGNTITASEMNVSTLSAIAADLGTITAGNITLNSSGYIKGGQTAYETGTGFWLGYDTDAYKFSIGNDNDHLKWTGSAIAMLCSGKDAITIDSGSDILLKEGGDIKFTSVVKPTACTGALAGDGAGNVDNGTHKYKVTYVNDTGETKLGTTSNTVTVDDKTSNGKINLTDIPISTSNSVTKRKIYRTKAGATIYYLLTTINNNTITTYEDNIADINLDTVNATNRQNTAIGTIIIDDTQRMFLGGSNIFIGNEAGYQIGQVITLTGDNNILVGNASGSKITSGRNNVFIGTLSGYNTTTGLENTFIGYNTGNQNTEGNYNTFLGLSSGFTNSTGNSNVFLGYNSGYYETGSNKLFIDNVKRTNEADGRIKALIYGVFASTTANQLIRLNGILELTSIKSGSTQANAGAGADEVWKTASHATLPDNVLMIGV